MKRLIVKLGLAAAVILISGQAYAAGTNAVAVTASVVGTCQFNAGAGALAFGPMDPSSAADVSAVPTNPTFWCTKNVNPITLTDDDGLNESGVNGNRMVGPTPADLIPYSMTYTPSSATGLGKTVPITLTLTGLVSNVDYVNAAVGAYSDTVTITVNP